MNSSKIKTQMLVAAATAVLAHTSQAGVPLNNIEGAGGVAFNPLAYLSGQNKPADQKGVQPLSQPQFGIWYVNLGDVKVDWTSIGISETFFERVELSYGHELIAPTGENIRKQNFGAKIKLLSENYRDQSYVPALAVGGIYKVTTPATDGSNTHATVTGYDLYAVATKLITQLPRPVLVSAGVLWTDGQTTGVFGYNDDHDLTFFGNIDVLPTDNLAIGIEYKQGAEFKTFRNADYWNAHVAWFANPHLTLVGAYVNGGDEKSTDKVGVGDGLVLSA